MVTGVESVGSAAWRPSVQSDTETARAGMRLRDSRPIARCHPDRELWAAGLCEDCFAARDRDRALQSQKALLGSPMAAHGHRLSPREEEVLLLISKGRTNKQLAYDLGISEQTVKNHMSSILRKTGASDRTQAVVMFLDGKRTEESAIVVAQRNVATIEDALLELRGSIDILLVELRAANAGEPVRRVQPVPPAPVETTEKYRCGHPLTAANTYQMAGYPRCRACVLAYQAEYRRRKRAA